MNNLRGRLISEILADVGTNLHHADRHDRNAATVYLDPPSSATRAFLATVKQIYDSGDRAQFLSLQSVLFARDTNDGQSILDSATLAGSGAGPYCDRVNREVNRMNRTGEFGMSPLEAATELAASQKKASLLRLHEKQGIMP